MGARPLSEVPPYTRLEDYHVIEDDFTEDLESNRWVATTGSGDGGSATVGDAVGGVLAILTNAQDNTEEYVESANETFKFAANKPLRFRARVQFTEASTNKANIIVGLMDAVAADALVNDGGGPKSSYSGAVFFKEDGQTLWSVEASISTTQTTAQLTAANTLTGKSYTAGTASGVYKWLQIEFNPISSTSAEIVFNIDGEDVYKMVGNFITNATEMQIVLGAKAGGASANETLNVDFVSCIQKR